MYIFSNLGIFKKHVFMDYWLVFCKMNKTFFFGKLHRLMEFEKNLHRKKNLDKNQNRGN